MLGEIHCISFTAGSELFFILRTAIWEASYLLRNQNLSQHFHKAQVGTTERRKILKKCISTRSYQLVFTHIAIYIVAADNNWKDLRFPVFPVAKPIMEDKICYVSSKNTDCTTRPNCFHLGWEYKVNIWLFLNVYSDLLHLASFKFFCIAWHCLWRIEKKE